MILVFRRQRLRSKVCAPSGGHCCPRKWGLMPECHVASRYCLLAGQSCTLPDDCDGARAGAVDSDDDGGVSDDAI